MKASSITTAGTTAGLGLVLLGIGALALLRAAGPEGAESPAVADTAAPSPEAAGGPAAPDPARGFVGVVVAGEAVDVAARIEGRVHDVRVRLGDAVARDHVLATLDDRPLRDGLAVAQASLRAARAEEKQAGLALEEAGERQARWSQMLGNETGVVSADEQARVRYEAKHAAARLEAARARVAEQQAQVAELERRIRDAVIRAPFDGLVAMRYVDPGATVQQGHPVVRLVGAGELRVRFAVPEGALEAATVAANRPVTVRIDELDVALDGVIEKVAPEIDAASGMILAEARLVVPEELARATLSGRVVRVRPVPQPRAARAAP